MLVQRTMHKTTANKRQLSFRYKRGMEGQVELEFMLYF